MLEAIYIIKDNVYFTWFALLIFFAGFCSSYLVNYFNIKFLLWFPHWFIKVMSRYINPKSGFLKIFLIIFLFNSISIAFYMISGIFVIFPFIIAFLTGMNIGITIFIPPQVNVEGYEARIPKGAGNVFKIMIFSTLVLILEVITFSAALGMGMSLGVAIYAVKALDVGSILFVYKLLAMRLNAYLLVCVPILAVSAYLEARVIKGV